MSILLKANSCATCGVIFGIVQEHDRQLRENHTTFWCPNGHRLSFTRSDADKRERVELESRLAEERNLRQLAENKIARLTKKKRVKV